MPKPGNKPANTKTVATKPVATNPTKKAVQPKKQVPNEVTKKETKHVPATAPKQKTDKRKREENESAPVHDVDKKMKEAPESNAVTPTGLKIIYTNVPDTAKISDFEALFEGLPERPHIKILSFRNKERVGDAYVYFRNPDAYEQATALTDLSIHGEQLTVVLDDKLDKERSIYVPYFPQLTDRSEIDQFFEGAQISRIIYGVDLAGRVRGSFFVEFEDVDSKHAALAKSNTPYKNGNVIVADFELNKPKLPKEKKTKKVPAKGKKTAHQKQAAAPKNQNKPAPVKISEEEGEEEEEDTPVPIKIKQAPAKKSILKPAAQQKKGANGKAKAQKKN